ncbi:S8 family serine peptidase [Monashia sp. NPDC004114]
MPDDGARTRTSPEPSIDNGEVVLRGTPITVSARSKLAEGEHRSVSVLGHRARASLAEDSKSVVIDTSTLPAGRHVLHTDGLVLGRGARLSSLDVEFVIVDSNAPIPEGYSLLHATRLRIGELDVEPLSMDSVPDGPYIDVFKAEDRRRRRRTPVDLAFDDRGSEVDVNEALLQLARRRREAFGRVHPALHELLTQQDLVPVAVWLATDDDPERVEKSTKRATLRRPRPELATERRWRAAVERVRPTLEDLGLEVQRVDERAPVIFGVMRSHAVRELADNEAVAAVFLHSEEGILDLTDSIAIANSDDAHSAGFDGTGVNVAVYEDGPDDTTNLAITARYTTTPATTQHSRHTHAIVKNIEPNRPHGHAPDCNLHSANSTDLAAVRWAAQDRGCTVISQSFHRDAEQTSSGLSFDDVYKDWLALQWPYPTICEAAGNGPDSEFVNHKGYNRVTVANHNDTASGMASDTCFRNPSSSHGDRELPEIAANGTNVTTVGLTFSGTSMAAPAVAGAVACMQEANGTLKSWPEGCRAILLASAWRNPAGGTWRSDLIAGVDGLDGSGALDTKAATDIARSRSSRNGPARRRGWDVGTSRSSDYGTDRFSTYSYRVAVPRTTLWPHVKVALAWDSHVTSFDFLGIHLPLSSTLTVDLDLHVRDSRGNQVAVSNSFDNSYEIAEFVATPGETYDVKIRRWSGTDDVWYGVAWTVTGLDILVGRVLNGGTVLRRA